MNCPCSDRTPALAGGARRSPRHSPMSETFSKLEVITGVTRRLPASLRPGVIHALGEAFAPEKLGDWVSPRRLSRTNAGLLFGRILLAGCPSDVADKLLGRHGGGVGFLSHRSLGVTKSSVPQDASFVSWALKRDIGRHGKLPPDDTPAQVQRTDGWWGISFTGRSHACVFEVRVRSADLTGSSWPQT